MLNGMIFGKFIVISKVLQFELLLNQRYLLLGLSPYQVLSDPTAMLNPCFSAVVPMLSLQKAVQRPYFFLMLLFNPMYGANKYQIRG